MRTSRRFPWVATFAATSVTFGWFSVRTSVSICAKRSVISSCASGCFRRNRSTTTAASFFGCTKVTTASPDPDTIIQRQSFGNSTEKRLAGSVNKRKLGGNAKPVRGHTLTIAVRIAAKRNRCDMTRGLRTKRRASLAGAQHVQPGFDRFLVGIVVRKIIEGSLVPRDRVGNAIHGVVLLRACQGVRRFGLHARLHLAGELFGDGRHRGIDLRGAFVFRQRTPQVASPFELRGLLERLSRRRAHFLASAGDEGGDVSVVWIVASQRLELSDRAGERAAVEGALGAAVAVGEVALPRLPLRRIPAWRFRN